MTIFILLILVGLLGCACAGSVYRDYRDDSVPKLITIPFMTVFIFLAIVSVIAGWMILIL